LRERGEPIRLFGETDYDAFQRLRKIEILTPEVNKVRSQYKATEISLCNITCNGMAFANCIIKVKLEK
jgi:hypothetical protein